MSKMKFSKKLFIVVGILLLIGVVFFVFSKKGNGTEYHEVKKGEFKKTVSVSGKVVPEKEAELGFASSGIVGSVRKDVGDKVYKGEVVVSLNSSKLQAEKQSTLSELDALKVELQDLKNNSTNSEVENKKKELVNVILEAYIKADDAIRNSVDQFYENPRTGPKIKYTFDDYFDTKNALNDGRDDVEYILVKWEKEIIGLSTTNFSNLVVDNSISYLSEISLFLRKVSLAVNSFESSSSLSQSTIDGYKSDISSARSSITETIFSVISAKNAYRNSLSLVSVKEAEIRSKQSEIQKLDAEISDTLIVAPFTGIISLQDAKVGQSISQNEVLVNIISESYEIEALIPEVSIPGVSVLNEAQVTFDAYGDVSFKASLTHIDPGETEKDGVSSYKIKLAFKELDSRIKPGMTVNVVIVTDLRSDVLSIPERAVIKEEGKTYVYVKTSKDHEKREIVAGERDGMGHIEVLNGLNVSEFIELNPAI